ncbi:anhydro-N-acetylmuramic acid kinase [Urechidicola croceus]|uniref:Anhydro-N-acetylmuramic acid kinase n=1 Tax=Urechidicola croceus TaxID=1850246 RepID=A0A1D8P6Z5_9FLAO|nr:anhydro-N-acetylmuramic acid kinase [Urechidicola croceus]AOW20343.1 anhydro-N-acetylmuramic acid kinase [Urechidicola croceus]
MNSNKSYVIGMMSGTSLDGVDLVYVSFSKNGEYSFEIICSKTFSYSDEWKLKLKNAFNQSKILIEKLNVEYGIYIGTLINSFISNYNIGKVDFIASHGHTIFHKPEQGYTLQIGDGDSISKLTGYKVVCDFRTQDVELGGQGAPLVPIGDKLLFSEYEYCLNLGGFANISFDKNERRIAFDICPVNIVLNHYANKLGLEYDNKGKIASQGNINTLMLEELNSLSFYTNQIPKSLGFEFVVSKIFPIIEKYNCSEQDILRTFIEHIAIQISLQIKNEGSLLITGGGAFNNFLIERLQKYIKNLIIIPNKTIINFKESLIFAFLGLLRLENKVNCLQSVTGAKKDHSSGIICNG